jgi:hypothetical protein
VAVDVKQWVDEIEVAALELAVDHVADRAPLLSPAQLHRAECAAAALLDAIEQTGRGRSDADLLRRIIEGLR